MNDRTSAVPASSGRSPLALGAACAFLVGFDSLVVSPLVPVITASAGVPIGTGGLMVTAYALAYMVVSPFLGPLSDRLGRRRLITAGLVIFGGATALIAATVSFPLILALRALSGIGASFIMPSVFAMIAESAAPERRGKAIGTVVASLMGASVAGVPIGALIAQFTSWQTTFLVIAGLSGLVVVAAWLGLPGRPQAASSSVGGVGGLRGYVRHFSAVLSDRSVGFTLLATFLWSLGLQTTFANAGLFYASSFGLGTASTGLAILGGGAASVVGNLVGGRLSDKLGRRRVIAVSAMIAGCAVTAFSAATWSLWAAVLAQIVWGLAVGLGQSALTTLQSELSPRARGTVMSLNSSAMYAGSTLGTGAASALLMLHVAFLGVGIVSAAATFLVVLVVSTFVRETAQVKQAA